MENRQELEAQAAQAISKARAALVLSRKFYAVLVGQVDPQPSWKFPTMATNSVTHYYNPAFIAGLSPEEVLGVQAHESEHDARHHCTRRGGRDPKLWNYACDYAINPDLLEEGFVLPKGALVRMEFKGMAAEEIYRILQQEGEQQQDQSEDEQSEGDDESGEGSQSQGGSEGDGTDGEPGSIVGDEGGCGEVLDAPGDEAEVADLDAKWEVVSRQAASLAKKAGTLPGHWEEIIERRKTPTQDWRAILREYIDAGTRQMQTWNRPNRRLAYSGTILPGNQREGVNKVAFIIDTSGSVSNVVLAKIAEEVQAAMDDGAISEAIAIYCDTRVNRVDRYQDGDRVEFKAPGRGGTNMRPAFSWIAENDPDASLIVCCTDLEIGDPGEEPDSPVLWCAWGDPRTVKNLGDSLPWGRVVDCGM